jgi:hypothetical protein
MPITQLVSQILVAIYRAFMVNYPDVLPWVTLRDRINSNRVFILFPIPPLFPPLPRSRDNVNG